MQWICACSKETSKIWNVLTHTENDYNSMIQKLDKQKRNKVEQFFCQAEGEAMWQCLNFAVEKGITTLLTCHYLQSENRFNVKKISENPRQLKGVMCKVNLSIKSGKIWLFCLQIGGLLNMGLPQKKAITFKIIERPLLPALNSGVYKERLNYFRYLWKQLDKNNSSSWAI